MASIAPISPDDYAAWLPLWNAYLDFYGTSLDPQTSSVTFERLTDPNSVIQGAIARDDGGAAVGIVHWLTHPATWTQTDYCYLEDLYVVSDKRGTGVGKALIEHVREWAERNGSAKVYWLTAESNAQARVLYDRVATRTGMIHYQVKLG